MAASFDTLRYARRLREAGVPEAQAESQAEALNEFLGSGAATKADLDLVRTELGAELRQTRTGLEARINLLQWMLGFELALTVAVLAKLLLAR
jgi:hypothetical protein